MDYIDDWKVDVEEMKVIESIQEDAPLSCLIDRINIQCFGRINP